MKNLLLCAAALLLFACNSSNTRPEGDTSTGNGKQATDRLDGYTVETVPGISWKSAIKKDTAGNVLETGFFEDDKKVGSWVLYENINKQFPSQISTYKDGKLTGLHIEFSDGGQAGLITYYQNNQLHGHWGRYQFGRVAEEADYKDGKLDGVYKVYTLATGKLQTTAEYKDGVQNGYYRTFTPEGQMTTEYLYKDGKKVSGGVVNSQ